MGRNGGQWGEPKRRTLKGGMLANPKNFLGGVEEIQGHPVTGGLSAGTSDAWPERLQTAGDVFALL